MKNIRIEFNYRANGQSTYLVIADTNRFGKDAVMFESYKRAECIAYIEKLGFKAPATITSAIDEDTKAAVEMIVNKTGLILDKVQIEYNDESCKEEKAAGLYFNGSKKIHLTTNCGIPVIIHEIGHYIHDVFFRNKEIRFSTENKSKYAYTNYKENFAECFMDYILEKKNTVKRNAEMAALLSGLN